MSNASKFIVGALAGAALVCSVAGAHWYWQWHARECHARGYSANCCRANLLQIEGAKSTWALEHKKGPEDTPSWSDIVGTNAYIAKMPVCTREGTYTLGAVGKPPRCSIPDHTMR